MSRIRRTVSRTKSSRARQSASADLARSVTHAPDRGFSVGYSPVVRPGSRRTDPAGMGMEFGVLRLRAGAMHRETTAGETVLVLLAGAGLWTGGAVRLHVGRPHPAA